MQEKKGEGKETKKKLTKRQQREKENAEQYGSLAGMTRAP
jgi:hypothetical protein